MLPEISGLDVCRAIRAESDVPIIMVTAKDSEADKVAGLEARRRRLRHEAVLRSRARLARESPPAPGRHAWRDRTGGGSAARRPRRDGCRPARGPGPRRGRRVPPKEFELLEAFLRRKDRLLTRTFLIEEVWGIDYVGDTKTLDVHVKRIRQKIEEDAHDPRHLVTVAGSGTSSWTDAPPGADVGRGIADETSVAFTTLASSLAWHAAVMEAGLPRACGRDVVSVHQPGAVVARLQRGVLALAEDHRARCWNG